MQYQGETSLENKALIHNRFYILDPLRFMAAYGVLLYHYSIYLNNHPSLAEIFKYGYLGVNFFFLLSGFVIMVSAHNRTAFQFAYARALRIYPTFIVCLLFTVIMVYIFSETRFSLAQILSNASILNDYLGIENIDGVYWTLQAELKFYGCIFLLLITGVFRYWNWWVGFWLAMSIAYYSFRQPFFLGWFINPEYSFYFIGGVCAYQMFIDRQSSLAKSYFIIALVFASIKSMGQTKDFLTQVDTSEKLIALACNIVFFSFFYFLARNRFSIRKKSYFITLGMISYPLYLTHNKAGKNIYEYLSGFNVGEIGALVLTSIFILGVCLGINYLVGLIPKINISLLAKNFIRQ